MGGRAIQTHKGLFCIISCASTALRSNVRVHWRSRAGLIDSAANVAMAICMASLTVDVSIANSTAPVAISHNRLFLLSLAAFCELGLSQPGYITTRF